MDDSVKVEWVKCKYLGDEAKRVSALAASGNSYYVLSSGKEAGQQYVVAAFKRVANTARADYLYELTEQELKAVLELEKKRYG